MSRNKEEVGLSSLKIDFEVLSRVLLAVSKKQSEEKIRNLYSEGQRKFGENYVQEALMKQRNLKDLDIEWHFIGHLQRNKVKQAVGHFELIHSVDSFELASSMNETSKTLGLKQKILFQVNLSGELTKEGLSPEELKILWEKVLKLSFLDIRGFMTMPPLQNNPEENRKYFRDLRCLLEKIKNQYSMPDDFCELSMGTSSDYNVAMEEGATLIRLGTKVFGDRG